jgi:hypothetical protein
MMRLLTAISAIATGAAGFFLLGFHFDRPLALRLPRAGGSLDILLGLLFIGVAIVLLFPFYREYRKAQRERSES